jgi:hypothetical protein
MSDASMSKEDHRHIFGSEVPIINIARGIAHDVIRMDLGDCQVDRLARMSLEFIDVFEAAHDMVHAKTDTASRRAYVELFRMVRELESKVR